MFIKLTIEEYGHAIQCGYERWMLSERAGRTDSISDKSWFSGLSVHISGAAGELAVAKSLGIYAPLHVNQFSGMAPDIPPCIEVRTRRGSGRDLIVRESDKDDRDYFLVIDNAPIMEVVGFVTGARAKQMVNLSDPNGMGMAYFIPRELLTPIEQVERSYWI